MASFSRDRSVTAVLADLLSQFTTLARTESELARAEITERLSKMVGGLVLVVAGAVLLIPALVILLQAAVAGLEQTGLEPYWSALAIGGGVFLIGIILTLIGTSRLKAKQLLPSKTIHQLQEDAAAARRQARSDNDYQRAA
jgi:hypothetical protein